MPSFDGCPWFEIVAREERAHAGPRAYFASEFVRRGIGPERLLFSDVSAHSSHLSVYGEVDISLDPFPWSGHTTACESLWMGVPVVSLCGNRHATRLAASVLTQVGRKSWIASNTEEYVRIAADLARDVVALENTRRELRSQVARSPLCDGVGFMAELHAVFAALLR